MNMEDIAQMRQERMDNTMLFLLVQLPNASAKARKEYEYYSQDRLRILEEAQANCSRNLRSYGGAYHFTQKELRSIRGADRRLKQARQHVIESAKRRKSR